MGVYGIHEITGLLGPARRVTAFAGITEPVRVVGDGPFKGTPIEVTAADNVLLMLDFGHSTYAVVDGTFNVSAARGPKVEIYGRGGAININSGPRAEASAPPLEVYRTDAVAGVGGWIRPESWALSMAQERVDQLQRAILVDHLVDCVWERRRPVLSAEHARHALEIMLKALDSARTGQALDLSTSF